MKKSFNDQVNSALSKIGEKGGMVAAQFAPEPTTPARKLPRLLRMDVLVTRRDKEGNLQAFSIVPVYEK